jgi:hypothetical protein
VAQYAALGVLVIVLVVVLAMQFGGARTPGTRPDAAAAAASRGPDPQQSEPAVSAVPDVKLAALRAAQAAPAEVPARNPFLLKPKPAPPPPPPARPALPGGGAAGGVDAAGQPLQPPPPPITLKFVGVVNPGGGAAKIAVLSGGTDVFYGREGDIIDGRYRIVSIGVESIVVAYVDGRGTRRIPLGGS